MIHISTQLGRLAEKLEVIWEQKPSTLLLILLHTSHAFAASKLCKVRSECEIESKQSGGGIRAKSFVNEALVRRFKSAGQSFHKNVIALFLVKPSRRYLRVKVLRRGCSWRGRSWRGRLDIQIGGSGSSCTSVEHRGPSSEWLQLWLDRNWSDYENRNPGHRPPDYERGQSRVRANVPMYVSSAR